MDSLHYIQALLERYLDLSITKVREELQNKAYEGYQFEVESQKFMSRIAKKTPKKEGYFVSFWEKDAKGNNQAYPLENFPDKFIVHIVDEEKIGLFIFSKECLSKEKILKTKHSKGKMAMRVYPEWCRSLNKQAEKTQKWQESYFINLTDTCNSDRLMGLLLNDV